MNLFSSCANPKEVVYDLLACKPSPPHAGGYETIDEKSVREHDIHCELKSYCLANVEVCFLAKWAALTWIDFEGLLIKMTPVCPFVKAARPDDATSRKPNECPHKHQLELEGKGKKDSGDSASTKKDSVDAASISPKCPFGYDSQTFKLGPLSCMICQALLFESSKCVPCSHVYCKACISRFKDCPLCGADIEKIEADMNLQNTVDRFIEGHGRIKRPHVNTDSEEAVGDDKTVIYEDVSLERGAFLVQHAMRAFRANNVESAKSRLSICAEDIRGQLEKLGNTSELCSQLGAVLGMLGDC
ncbi:Protein NCA1 [Vitis vinifera]|uniref:Protein NCA1 n=1 Tax=Vitis vinifera TaxID=29760 RepID=A0A438EBS8_VITVI|nr:Protein NCA1 [Vitis vinifera]